MFWKQEVRVHSSAYNEIVLRTEIKGISMGWEERKIGEMQYFTDDSMRAVERKVWKDREAEEKGFDFGDDQSMLG
jgi:hypothetical protein